MNYNIGRQNLMIVLTCLVCAYWLLVYQYNSFRHCDMQLYNNNMWESLRPLHMVSHTFSPNYIVYLVKTKTNLWCDDEIQFFLQSMYGPDFMYGVYITVVVTSCACDVLTKETQLYSDEIIRQTHNNCWSWRCFKLCHQTPS